MDPGLAGTSCRGDARNVRGSVTIRGGTTRSWVRVPPPTATPSPRFADFFPQWRPGLARRGVQAPCRRRSLPEAKGASVNAILARISFVLKFVIIGFFWLALLIPLAQLRSLVDERTRFAESAVAE